MNSVFTDRWSPRAFSDAPVTDEQLAALFEAARWTPSWMNNQPWYFVYATEGDDKQAILDVFMDFNRGWAQHAPVAGLMIAKTDLEDFMARTRDYDAGMAGMAMCIQATMLGLSVHMLGGIEIDAAHELIGLDANDGIILGGFVLGHRGDASQLEEKLQEREQPSDRKPVSEFAFKGTKFGG